MICEKSRLVEAELSLGNLGVAEQGALLWEEACDRVQSGELDDRPLYWRRLGRLTRLICSITGLPSKYLRVMVSSGLASAETEKS